MNTDLRFRAVRWAQQLSRGNGTLSERLLLSQVPMPLQCVVKVVL